ncbi:MAG: DedA family membrane protein [Microgenomates group bacterium GW2011_GWC1_44_23]|nr:MAG: DedA family membrane protein [Microgenomates group bacterium GW2011_GWC1_44_23]
MILDFFLHIDKNLALVTAQYGTMTYLILFLVIFMETGLVVTPFLPGDSLLFAAGALAAMGSFDFWILYPLMLVAAIVGDTVNYWIGDKFEKSVFERGSKIFKKEYLEQAEEFYRKYGGRAIVFARFVPIVRTFAPFVAGISKMHYGDFIKYNMVGGFAWFGNLPVVKENFHYLVLGIIVVSLVPIFVEVRKRRKSVIK